MKDTSSLENKRKHASLVCTICMDEGVRAVLKTQYHRVDKKFEPSGIYQCQRCHKIAIDYRMYPAYRTRGLHIIWNLESLQESVNE